MGKCIDEFCELMTTCTTELSEEVIPVMYNVLTNVGTDDAPERTTLPVSPLQVLTIDRLTDAINRVTSIGVNEGFLIISLLRTVSDVLKRLSDREARHKERDIILTTIKMSQTSSDQAIDQDTMARLSYHIQDLDERVDQVQSLYSQWTRIVDPYLENTMLTASWLKP